MPFPYKIVCLSTAVVISLSGCLFEGMPIGMNSDINSITTSVSQTTTTKAKTPAPKATHIYSTNDTLGFYTASLSADEKKVFGEVYKGIMNYQKRINVTHSVIPSDNIDEFLTFVTSVGSDIHQLSENYGLYADDNGFVTALDMEYTRNSEVGKKELAKLKTKINIISKKVQPLSDYDKLKFFHDYILRFCSYSVNAPNPYSAYGCLVDGKAVCEGYSKAFAMLCQSSGIPCINVIGNANDGSSKTEAHMWNMVKLDGNWYHIDVTWDDPKGIFGSDYLKYDYFNVSDEMIKSDHQATKNMYMNYPVANSIRQNYYVKQGLFLKDNADSKAFISNTIKKSLDSSDRYVRFRCQSDKKYSSVTQEFFNSDNNNEGFFDLLCNTVDKYGYAASTAEYSLVESPETRIITIQLELE